MSFTPFDDTQTVARPPRPTSNGYNTSAWDQYRQGVEIINDRFRFLGTQPKMWSGTTNGQIDLVTYGQTQGFIQENPLGLESKFKDLPKFDPVGYIVMGDNYPLPIVFNDGPMEQAEALIEPLSIPFRKHSNEGPFYAHAVRGEMEDGNNFDSYVNRGSNKITQFQEFAAPSTSRYFLDDGGDYFGNVFREQFVPTIERLITPFDDTQGYNPANKLSTTNPIIRSTIFDGASLGPENLLPYGQRSATAGTSYYGLNAGQYGTDSIAFGGWALGS